MAVVTHEVHGLGVTFHVRPDTSDETVIDEVWTDQYRWPREIMPYATVLDLGANIGALTLWATAAGATLVRAVEPEPSNFAQLTRNINANPHLAPRIEALQVAAGVPGTVNIKTRDDWPAGAWTGPGAGISSVPLSELLDGMGDSVTVKIDIEGAEYALLHHADRATMNRILRIAMEFHPCAGPGTLGDRPWGQPPGAFGAMIEKLTETHGVHTHGHAAVGGLIWADRL